MKAKLYLTLIAVIFLAQACSNTGTRQVSKSAQPYDFDRKPIHADIRLFHDSADSSTVYYSINTSELLYARINPEEAFKSNLIIHADVISGSNLIDSAVVQVLDTNESRLARNLTGRLRVHIPDTLEGELNITFSDQLKRIKAKEVIYFDKRNSLNEHNYLPFYSESREIIYNSGVKSGKNISIQYRSSVNELLMERYLDEVKLPPPPFSYYNPEPLSNMTPYSNEKLAQQNGGFRFRAENGLYWVTAGVENSEGICLQVRSDDFPRVTELEQMTQTLRYITSRKEFEDITLSNNTKVELDNFWLDCGGGMDKARELIAMYYDRIEEANSYFSCHTEGWKTDRGLIHIVYGNPTKVVNRENYENWIYGEENNINTLSFSFKKEPNKFSDNYYVLLRDPIYKSSWSRAVDSWRNGRVYND